MIALNKFDGNHFKRDPVIQIIIQSSNTNGFCLMRKQANYDSLADGQRTIC